MALLRALVLDRTKKSRIVHGTIHKLEFFSTYILKKIAAMYADLVLWSSPLVFQAFIGYVLGA